MSRTDGLQAVKEAIGELDGILSLVVNLEDELSQFIAKHGKSAVLEEHLEEVRIVKWGIQGYLAEMYPKTGLLEQQIGKHFKGVVQVFRRIFVDRKKGV